jgi:hypothetical protein
MTDLALVTRVDEQNPIEHDLRLVDGMIPLVEGLDAIRQDLVVSLRWFYGEWFLDRRAGLPWFEEILGHKAGVEIVERILRRAILQRPGITSIDTLVVSINAERERLVSFRARTVEGPLELRDFVLEGGL